MRVFSYYFVFILVEVNGVNDSTEGAHAILRHVKPIGHSVTSASAHVVNFLVQDSESPSLNKPLACRKPKRINTSTIVEGGSDQRLEVFPW